MRAVFNDTSIERRFRADGFVVVDLLDTTAITELLRFYEKAFQQRRPVTDYARELPYYISIFDRDNNHRREVDRLIFRHVSPSLPSLMCNYEVVYSNYMIKFPGDSEIEAHQDFNFVDETKYVACNLWSPLVDVAAADGGLFVVPGSHRVFRTQRGPNLPKALTEYNALLKRYGRWLEVKPGQAVIFDHRLIHYSSPNAGERVRVAVQSVLKPIEAAAVHYVYNSTTARVTARQIDTETILCTDMWDSDLSDRPIDHEQELIPFPAPDEMHRLLVDLRLSTTRAHSEAATPVLMRDPALQKDLESKGFAKLPLLGQAAVEELLALFDQSTDHEVENGSYGMYVGLEEPNVERRRATVHDIAAILAPAALPHFVDCKPHLGSFLVKVPGPSSFTYPHRDWTFVDTPNVSVTVWVALTATCIENGALGFVPGSHRFFTSPVGSPSMGFRTSTQRHEPLLYEYLEFVPLQPGEAVVFDNRTIHGAPANISPRPRLAAAIGMTPRDAQLYHYFQIPGSDDGTWRELAKLPVDEAFFETHSVTDLDSLFAAGQLPDSADPVTLLRSELTSYTAHEIELLCARSGLAKNGQRLAHSEPAHVHLLQRASKWLKRLAS